MGPSTESTPFFPTLAPATRDKWVDSPCRTDTISRMRDIQTQDITAAVAKLCTEANYSLGEDLLAAVRKAQAAETSPVGKEILGQILENAEIGRSQCEPTCQDTGVSVVFVELGQDVHVAGGALRAAIDEGVRRGYEEGYLRKSIVCHPLDRVNTRDNTPAIVHVDVVEGDGLKFTLMAKGGGCENMSRTAMLSPAQGREGVIDFVVNAVSEAGANPCPPVVLGVGLGGSFDKAALLAKRALLRPVGQPAAEPADAELEAEMLEQVNALGIGPQGLGGRTTALAVHVESHPCHIASLPAAVNFDCHAHRHKSVVL